MIEKTIQKITLFWLSAFATGNYCVTRFKVHCRSGCDRAISVAMITPFRNSIN